MPPKPKQLAPNTFPIVHNCEDKLILDLDKVDRKIAIRTWLIYHGISEKNLADSLNLCPSTVTRFIDGERRSTPLTDKLVDMGLPKKLLPQDAAAEEKQNHSQSCSAT